MNVDHVGRGGEGYVNDLRPLEQTDYGRLERFAVRDHVKRLQGHDSALRARLTDPRQGNVPVLEPGEVGELLCITDVDLFEGQAAVAD